MIAMTILGAAPPTAKHAAPVAENRATAAGDPGFAAVMDPQVPQGPASRVPLRSAIPLLNALPPDGEAAPFARLEDVIDGPQPQAIAAPIADPDALSIPDIAPVPQTANPAPDFALANLNARQSPVEGAPIKAPKPAAAKASGGHVPTSRPIFPDPPVAAPVTPTTQSPPTPVAPAPDHDLLQAKTGKAEQAAAPDSPPAPLPAPPPAPVQPGVVFFLPTTSPPAGHGPNATPAMAQPSSGANRPMPHPQPGNGAVSLSDAPRIPMPPFCRERWLQ